MPKRRVKNAGEKKPGLFHKLWLNAVNSVRRFKRVLLKTKPVLKRINSKAGT